MGISVRFFRKKRTEEEPAQQPDEAVRPAEVDPMPFGDEEGDGADVEAEQGVLDADGESGDGPPDGGPPDEGPPGTFSIMELRDRVVIMLLFDQVVREEHVEEAWQRWHRRKSDATTPLWRVLLEMPDLDREAIYREAAKVYAFEEAKVVKTKALPLIRDVAESLGKDQVSRMIELRLLPVSVDQDTDGEAALVFATHDPGRNSVMRFLQRLGIQKFVLRYAPEAVIGRLIVEAFWRNRDFLDVIQDSQWADAIRGFAQDLTADDLHAFYAIFGALAPEKEEEQPEPTFVDEHTLLVGLFEEALVEIKQRAATGIAMLPTAERTIEVHLERGEERALWKVEDRVYPESLVAFVYDEILQSDRTDYDAVRKRTIARWIDNVLHHFEVRVEVMEGEDLDVYFEYVHILYLDPRKARIKLKQLNG